MLPHGQLFPGRIGTDPIPARPLRRVMPEAAERAEIHKQVSPHTSRDLFATHMHEQGVDIRVIQLLLGHVNGSTTGIYTQVSSKTMRAVARPLDQIVAVMEGRAPPGQADARLTRGRRHLPQGRGCISRGHAGHLSLGQLKIMTAIENCSTAALGGHFEACDDCGRWRISWSSFRNRHCPKCQAAAARTWLLRAPPLPMAPIREMRHDQAWLSLHDDRANGVLADEPVHGDHGSEPGVGHTGQQNHHRSHSDAEQSHVDPARAAT